MLLASQYVSLKFIESESNNTATLTLTACALAAKTTSPLQHQEGQI